MLSDAIVSPSPFMLSPANRVDPMSTSASLASRVSDRRRGGEAREDVFRTPPA
jgi:hypothetical protein